MNLFAMPFLRIEYFDREETASGFSLFPLTSLEATELRAKATKRCVF